MAYSKARIFFFFSFLLFMLNSPCYNASKGRYFMKKMIFMTLLTFLFVFSSVSPLTADTREEPVAVFLVLDKSLSMEEEIESVKEYVNNSIIDKFIIVGDFFTLIQFYGEAQTLIQTYIHEENDKEEIKQRILNILADGRFTDIGNALDTLEKNLEDYPDDDRRTYLFLITDGIQEAPPWSEYYSPDGSFNHRFLEHTKTIQKKGWKIQILGIGNETAAEAVAKELSGGYIQVPAEPDARDIEKSAQDIFGIVELRDASLSPIRTNGGCTLELTLETSGYNEPVDLTISEITASIPGQDSKNILTAPVELQPSLDTETKFEIPVLFKGGRESLTDGQEIELRFVFSGQEVFIPSSTTLHISYAGFFSEHRLLSVLIIGIAAVLIVILLLVLRNKSAGALRFTCTIEDGPEITKHMSLQYGRRCYILLGPTGFTISPVKKGDVCAEVIAESDSLKLNVTDEKLFKPVSPVPRNLIGARIKVRKEDGTYGYISFSNEKKNS